jgi:hypothetical protein
MAMYEQADKSEDTMANKIGDAQEPDLRDFVRTVERMQKMEARKSIPEDTSSELFSEEELEALDEKITALEKFFLGLFKDFLAERPQWLPEDRVVIDGCDEGSLRSYYALTCLLTYMQTLQFVSSGLPMPMTVI